MSRLKRFFRRKNDKPTQPQPLVYDETEQFVYRRPDFRHSLYENTQYGAPPDYGDEPLRSHGASASRPDSIYAQSAYEEVNHGGRSRTSLRSFPGDTRGGSRDWAHEVDGMMDRMSRTRLNDQRVSEQPANGNVRQQNISKPDVPERASSRHSGEKIEKPLPRTPRPDSSLTRNPPSTGDLRTPRKKTTPTSEPKPTIRPVNAEITSPSRIAPSITSSPKAAKSISTPSKTTNAIPPPPKATTTVPSASEVVAKSKYDSVDTDIHTRVAPAVTHETVNHHVHEIREEHITREIHEHDVYHRILPIVDVEVLPARHFRQEGKKLVEIRPEDIPGRAQHWVIAETLSKGSDYQPGPRDFTARKFPGTEGDAKDYVDKDGVHRTEQTWIHHPELETGAKATGQTVPIVL